MKTSRSKEPKVNNYCYNGVLIEIIQPPNFEEIKKTVKRELKKLIWSRQKK